MSEEKEVCLNLTSEIILRNVPNHLRCVPCYGTYRFPMLTMKTLQSLSYHANSENRHICIDFFKYQDRYITCCCNSFFKFVTNLNHSDISLLIPFLHSFANNDFHNSALFMYCCDVTRLVQLYVEDFGQVNLPASPYSLQVRKKPTNISEGTIVLQAGLRDVFHGREFVPNSAGDLPLHCPTSPMLKSIRLADPSIFYPPNQVVVKSNLCNGSHYPQAWINKSFRMTKVGKRKSLSAHSEDEVEASSIGGEFDAKSLLPPSAEFQPFPVAGAIVP